MIWCTWKFGRSRVNSICFTANNISLNADVDRFTSSKPDSTMMPTINKAALIQILLYNCINLKFLVPFF